jgi:predicted transcriptional regulator
LYTGKTPCWAGATPYFGPVPWPKGVAPAQSTQKQFARAHRSREAPSKLCGKAIEVLALLGVTAELRPCLPNVYTHVTGPECGEEKDSEYREEDIRMSVLKAPPKQPKTTVVQLRLDDEVRVKLAKYAEFLDCSPSYVVAEALKFVCNKDKEFQSWLSGQHVQTSEPATKEQSFQLEMK